MAVAAFAALRIGVGTLLTAMVAGQLAMAIALDHFGALGLPRTPAGAGRLLGLALVIAGAVLVRRGIGTGPLVSGRAFTRCGL